MLVIAQRELNGSELRNYDSQSAGRLDANELDFVLRAMRVFRAESPAAQSQGLQPLVLSHTNQRGLKGRSRMPDLVRARSRMWDRRQVSK